MQVKTSVNRPQRLNLLRSSDHDRSSDSRRRVDVLFLVNVV